MGFVIKDLGLCDYEKTWHAMQDFTAQRDKQTPDEIWLLEHPATFTLGRNGKPEHLLQQSEIPLIHIDRGGQITFHGVGQLVIYLLLDIKRLKLGVRALVTAMEAAIIALLKQYHITAQSNPKAPGVYVNGKKIAALGLRIKRGYSYHGLSLNIAMDLIPFSLINPCGYKNLEVTQCCDLGISASYSEIKINLLNQLLQRLEKKH